MAERVQIFKKRLLKLGGSALLIALVPKVPFNLSRQEWPGLFGQAKENESEDSIKIIDNVE